MAATNTEVDMLEHTEHGTEKSELVSTTASLKPQFKGTEEAINFYAHKLEIICAKNKKAVEDFLFLAEQNSEYHPDMIEALSLAKTIRSLKRIQNEEEA